MFRAPKRGRRRLRLLWTRTLRRLREALRHATNGLLRQLRRRAHSRRPGDGIDFAEEPAKRAGQCALFLPVRRAVAGGGNGCEVLSAFAVPDLVHNRLRCRFHRVRILVWPDRQKTKSVRSIHPESATRRKYFSAEGCILFLQENQPVALCRHLDLVARLEFARQQLGRKRVE